MTKRKLAALFSALMIVCGIVGLVTLPAANAATEPALTKSSWTFTETGAIVPKGTSGATSIPPLNNWQFSFSAAAGNQERLLCIKDYTQEPTSYWNPQYTAHDWALANNWFHMYWDDMNGAGDNCGGYDHYQTINIYSYSGPTTDGCAILDLEKMLENNKVRVWSATIWLNRTSDSYGCRYNGVMRQNMTSRTVGWMLGLGWDSGAGPDLMNLSWAQRASYPSLLAGDKQASDIQYSDS